VQQAAEKQGVSPREWADTTVERYRDAWQLLDIANDDFIRTTEPRHHAASAEIWRRRLF
jgi:methionyl-tRNA synthetase